MRVRKQLDCRSVSYTSLNKESHVLEVPESAAGRMPSSYSLVGHRKGFKRYTSEELKELVADKQAAEEDREKVQAGVLRVSRGRYGWYAQGGGRQYWALDCQGAMLRLCKGPCWCPVAVQCCMLCVS